MKLYHGTNIDFQEIDIAKSNLIKILGEGSTSQAYAIRPKGWP